MRGSQESVTGTVEAWNLKGFQGIPSPIIQIQMDQWRPNVGGDCAGKHE